MSIAANKIPNIRAAACSEPYSAILSKRHNNSNVLCLGARVVASGLATLITEGWLNAAYEGERHQRRVDMLTRIEQRYAIPFAPQAPREEDTNPITPAEPPAGED
jgi:ribose 5-phosphate isomerase B